MPLLTALLLLVWQIAAAAAPLSGLRVDVLVVDRSNQPLAGVRISLTKSGQPVAAVETDAAGRAEFLNLDPAGYAVRAEKLGFEPVDRDRIDLTTGGSASLDLTLVPALEQHESIDVRAAVAPVETGATSASTVPTSSAREQPSRPATVSDVLPLVPGVARAPGGGIQISGAGEHRSALIVNSADVTDPATGQFGLTVPIDQVETVNVYQTPFLAEFGRFSAGLVSVETRRGGDKWKWDLNDPFPDFRIRSYHLRGLRDATPRLNVEGPLIPGKLYFSEGFEYEIRKTEVYTLPFPNNQKKQEGINSFAQFDWIASAKQLVTATIHVAPQRMDFVNMNYFNPQPTTPEAGTHNYTGTLADRLSTHVGLLENTLSITQFDARVWGQGTQDLIMTPTGNSGSYFAEQTRNASRLGWLSTLSPAAITWLGTHNLKAGSYFADSTDRGQVTEHPIDILDAASQLTERITFSGGAPFSRTDHEMAFFVQDHWLVSPRLAFDLGLRAESQEVSESMRLAPRVGIAWNPIPDSGLVVRAGVGLFFDRVPLNVYSFDHYPNQTVTMYNATGQIAGGPFVYQNGLGQVNGTYPFVFQEPVSGSFSPRSSTWSVQVEQPIAQFLRLRAGYMQNQSSGLVVLNPLAPDPATQAGAMLLSGSGRSTYRQLEFTARLRMGEGRQLFFSYVNSRAQGDLNDFGNFLGSFPVPIVRTNQFGNLPTDLPNRFLAWGLVKLPWHFRIAPVLEFRNGFPYAAIDAAQNYAGIPYQSRYPDFLSVDARVSKDIKVNPKYSVRLSVSGFNLTNHFNPEAFHNNIADPAYGLFFGQRGRRFTADFDVIF